MRPNKQLSKILYKVGKIKKKRNPGTEGHRIGKTDDFFPVLCLLDILAEGGEQLNRALRRERSLWLGKMNNLISKADFSKLQGAGRNVRFLLTGLFLYSASW